MLLDYSNKSTVEGVFSAPKIAEKYMRLLSEQEGTEFVLWELAEDNPYHEEFVASWHRSDDGKLVETISADFEELL